MSHPYSQLPGHQFWSSAVSGVAPHELDPEVAAPERLGRTEPIATIGSCFAQHLSRHLDDAGMSYLVTETGPTDVDEDAARERGFGVFSARYGNVYTVRQALQLFDRAYGSFVPDEPAWSRRDGAVADPFRPTVEPSGFNDVDALEKDRSRHLEATRRVFEDCRALVFTLGLTEGWASRADGAMLPVAPGVAAGSFDPSAHEFVNFRSDEVVADLSALAERFRRVNPSGLLLLTVSPVPLVATYEARHVLVSTTYSKSVLRAAAGEVAAALDHVHYFPSYEIITAPGQADRYYADDLREVTPEGVAHVMRVFTEHWTELGGHDVAAPVEDLAASHSFVEQVVCDEELIEESRAG